MLPCKKMFQLLPKLVTYFQSFTCYLINPFCFFHSLYEKVICLLLFLPSLDSKKRKRSGLSYSALYSVPRTMHIVGAL